MLCRSLPKPRLRLIALGQLKVIQEVERNMPLFSPRVVRGCVQTQGDVQNKAIRTCRTERSIVELILRK